MRCLFFLAESEINLCTCADIPLFILWITPLDFVLVIHKFHAEVLKTKFVFLFRSYFVLHRHHFCLWFYSEVGMWVNSFLALQVL